MVSIDGDSSKPDIKPVKMRMQPTAEEDRARPVTLPDGPSEVKKSLAMNVIYDYNS